MWKFTPYNALGKNIEQMKKVFTTNEIFVDVLYNIFV